MAAGVASDSAHGQVTTRIATAIIMAWPGSLGHHHTAAATAASTTNTRNGLASRSASCATVGLLTEACSIKDTICA